MNAEPVLTPPRAFSASTADDESLRSRAASWSRIAGAVFGRHDANLLRRADPFHGAIRYRAIGDYAMSDIRTGPHELQHAGPTAPATRGVLHLNLVLKGDCEPFHQAGKAAPLAPGDLLIDDGDAPYSMRIPGEFHVLSLHFPKSSVPPAFGRPDGIVAVRVPHDAPEAGLLGSLMTSIAAADTAMAASETLLADAAVSLAAAAVLRLTGGPSDEAARETHLRRAKAFIESRLPDPGLSPASIAAATHISLRHLHAVFELERETPAAYVLARRLESAAALLRDRALAELPVAEIGRRCGFPDASHFGRAFARRFGDAPARYRAEAHGTASA